MSSEYNNSAIHGGACSYTNLSSYNSGAQGMNSRSALSSLSSASKNVLVPSFGGPAGYNTLTGKVPSCSGYSNMQSAYSNNTGCGSQYVSNLCQP